MISQITQTLPFCDFQTLKSAKEYMEHSGGPYALLVKKQTFAPYKLPKDESTTFALTREAAVKKIVDSLGPTDVVVGSTGMLSRELYEYRFTRFYTFNIQCLEPLIQRIYLDTFPIFLYISVLNFKRLISQSIFSGTRKFMLRY